MAPLPIINLAFDGSQTTDMSYAPVLTRTLHE